VDQKSCKACRSTKSIQSFELIRGGPNRRQTCHTCRARKKRKYNPAQNAVRQAQARTRNPHTYILIDCRNSDRKKGLSGNDLDGETVKDLISKPCLYCGSANPRMTLDRIDNARAHSRDNVNPSCLRCNLLRGDMPYPAWMALAPKIREITEAGLFGDWKTKPVGPKRRQKDQDDEAQKEQAR